jgi:hypothetical protein
MKQMIIWIIKNFNISAIFLVFFIVSESIMRGIDYAPLIHIGSVLCFWYVFASFFVSYNNYRIGYFIFKIKRFLEYTQKSYTWYTDPIWWFLAICNMVCKHSEGSNLFYN